MTYSAADFAALKQQIRERAPTDPIQLVNFLKTELHHLLQNGLGRSPAFTEAIIQELAEGSPEESQEVLLTAVAFYTMRIKEISELPAQ